MALKHNPDNEEAKHALSALVADPTVTTASTAYITSLFDEYAATFDKALVQDLNYTAPQKIHEVVSELAARSGIKSFKTSLKICKICLLVYFAWCECRSDFFVNIGAHRRCGARRDP